MATSFRDLSLPMQALVFAVIAVALIAAGFYVPQSPIADVKARKEAAQKEVAELKPKVASLQVIKRKVGEVRNDLDGLQREIANLRNIVPEDKETDEFIRKLNAAAQASSVSIRRLTAKSVVVKELYAEMPFELEIDGPYYNIQNFFARLGGESRIINVGDMNFSGITEGRSKKFQVRPGTSVTGTFVATTFFTKAATEQPPAKSAPAKPGAPAPAPK